MFQTNAHFHTMAAVACMSGNLLHNTHSFLHWLPASNHSPGTGMWSFRVICVPIGQWAVTTIQYALATGMLQYSLFSRSPFSARPALK